MLSVAGSSLIRDFLFGQDDSLSIEKKQTSTLLQSTVVQAIAMVVIRIVILSVLIIVANQREINVALINTTKFYIHILVLHLRLHLHPVVLYHQAPAK